MPAKTLRDRLADLLLPVLDGDRHYLEVADEVRALLAPPPPPWPYDAAPFVAPLGREEWPGGYASSFPLACLEAFHPSLPAPAPLSIDIPVTDADL